MNRNEKRDYMSMIVFYTAILVLASGMILIELIYSKNIIYIWIILLVIGMQFSIGIAAEHYHLTRYHKKE